MLRDAADYGEYPLIEIIGPHEFLPDRKGEEHKARLNAKEAQKSFKAYELLAPDLVYTSPESAEWFKHHGYKTPKNFVTVEEKPLFVRLNIPGGPLSLGLVLAPPATGPKGQPSKEQIAEILRLAEEKKSSVSLMALVTPWGFYPEHQAIEGGLQEKPLFNLVLGGGSGSALSASINPKNPAVLWGRSDSKGTSLLVLDFFDLPSGPDWKWELDKNVEGAFLDLKPHVLSDPEMTKIVGEPPKATGSKS